MQYRATRLLLAASALVLLGGCSTTLIKPDAASPLSAQSAGTATAPSVPGAVPEVSPAQMPGTKLVGSVEASGTALLGGETAKEFQQGKASWYGPRFHLRRTASGERYDMHALTAAHKTLPFGTMVRVRSLVNGKEIDVRITDRGPFARGRVIDLSRAAAEALDMLSLGVKDVLLMVPESLLPTPPEPPAKPARSSRRQ